MTCMTHLASEDLAAAVAVNAIDSIAACARTYWRSGVKKVKNRLKTGTFSAFCAPRAVTTCVLIAST